MRLVNRLDHIYSGTMSIRGSLIAVFLLLSITYVSCAFGPTPFRGIMSYRHGKVYLRKDKFYRVGSLPDGWQRLDTGVRAISFYNDQYGASITTDAFCGKSIEGRRVDSLGGEMLTALQDREVTSEKNLKLGGRGAVRQKVKGKLDGVNVLLDLVIVSKNACAFDFYSISQESSAPEVEAAFEGFFGGFQFE